MGKARITNDDYNIYSALAEGNLKLAQRMLYSQVTAGGRYSENPQAEYFRHELGKFLSIEVPPPLLGHLKVTMPDGIDDRLYYLRDNEKHLMEDILHIKDNIDAMKATGIRYINSCLLIGPPGTGKTFFAGILAKKLGLPLVSINISTIISSLLGETSKRIADIFRFVNSTECVFFMDELDTYGGPRGNTKNDVKEMARVTVAIMTELDNLPTGSIVIAATNRPEAIDKALRRRFERIEEIPPFTREDAILMIYHYMEAIGMGFPQKEIEKALPAADDGCYFQFDIVSNLNHGIIAAYPERLDMARILAGIGHGLSEPLA